MTLIYSYSLSHCEETYLEIVKLSMLNDNRYYYIEPTIQMKLVSLALSC